MPDTGSAPPETVIQVEGLTKVYGEVRAVDDISFSVRSGEVFAFLGPNGAGKTTTVEVLESIRTPTKGSITVFGRDLQESMKSVRERIGVLPQEFRSYDRLTVRETLQYYQRLYDRRVWEVDDIMELLGLDEKRDTQYMYLSGGLKQRVGVGIALVNDPDIVFLDEPTTGLDPRARREVWGIIRLLKEKGKTIFLTTHYMEEAEQLADRVCIIHRGRIIARGSVGDLLAEHGERRMMRISGCTRDCLVDMAGDLKIPIDPLNSAPSIPVPDIDTAMKMLNYLRETGVEYREVDIMGPTLEDVFLSLTGEPLGSEPENGLVESGAE